MAKSNFGYIGARGAQAVQNSLQDLIADRLAAQELAKKESLARESTWQKNLESQRDYAINLEQLNISKGNAARAAANDAKPKYREIAGVLKDGKRKTVIVPEGPGEFDMAEADRPRTGFEAYYNRAQERLGRALSQDEERSLLAEYTKASDSSPASGDGELHLPAKETENLKTMEVIDTLTNEILDLGKGTGWEGVGGGGVGAASEWVSNQFGWGSDTGRTLRANLGNIQSKIQNVRGGLTMTDNEIQQVAKFVGNANNSPEAIIAKLQAFQHAMDIERDAIAKIFKAPRLASTRGKAPAEAGASGAGGGTVIEWETGPDGKPRMKGK